MRIPRWRPILRLSVAINLVLLFAIGTHAAPSITSLNPTSGVVGMSVTITGTNFGSSQGTSTVTFNGTSATPTGWSTTSISVTVPSGATTGNVVVTVSGVASNGAGFTVLPIPTGWADGDVGTVGLAGSASFASGTFTVSGAGQGITGSADGFHFAYQPLSGDGTIVARIVSRQGSGIQAGVMIRETLTAGSANIFANYASSYIDLTERMSAGVSTSNQADIYGAPPYWVKLVRSGNTISGFASPDGINWVALPPGQSNTFSMAQNVYVGLTVSSGSTSSLATATFDNVSVGSTATPAPVITSLSATTGSIGSQITITGSGFGTSQGSSIVLLNAVPVTINSWSNGSIQITIPTGATTGRMVVSVAPSMNNSNPVEFEVTAQPLPQGWLDQDIGQVGVLGASGFNNGTFSVTGAGSGVTSAADGFHFVYQPLSGDGTIIARVVSVTGSSTQAGIMIRETLAPGSANIFANCGPYYVTLDERISTGAQTSNQPDIRGTAPYWLKLVRSGNTITAYASPNGVNWTVLAPGLTNTFTMAQNVYVGLAVSSESTSSTATATFDSVSVNSAASPAPVISGLSATTGSIGSQATIYGSGFGNTQGNSLVLLNSSSVTINNWTSTAITFTIPSGATSGALVVSVASSANDSNPVGFAVTSQPLPITWLDGDVGQPGQLAFVGSATFLNGTYTITGEGSGVYGTADSMHFAYQPLAGDGTIVARVSSITGGTSSLQVGVMIRESLSPNAATASVSFYPNQAFMYYRTLAGASSSVQSISEASSAYPYWVRLVRSGNTFTGSISLDGMYWVQIGASVQITMAENAYIGLTVSSNSSGQSATATFDNVSVDTTTGPAPTITGVSATTGSIGSRVVIYGRAFGASQGGSLVNLHSAPVTINSWSDTSITITIPSAATTGLLGVTVAPTMNCSNTVWFTVTTQPLAATWLDQDIGNVGLTGSATYSNGTFTIKAAGQSIANTLDGFHFVYQPLSGDGTIVARVSNIQGGYSPQIGVMIRESVHPGSTMAFVDFIPNTGNLEVRTTTGGSTTQQYASFQGPNYPYWVKLTRSGNVFMGYVSADATNWTLINSQTITMAQNVLIGMAVSNQTTGSLVTASFDSVSVSSNLLVPPAITGVSATTGAVGTQVSVSGSGFGATQGSSSVVVNGSPVTINSWIATAINITIPTGATSGYLEVLLAPSMNSSNPVVFEVTSQPLPTGWLDTDIGYNYILGSATYSGGAFTVKASGAGVHSTADSLHFVYQPLSGDGLIVARVSSITGGDASTQIGVMIRETLSPGATNAFVWYYPNESELYERTTTGGSTNTQTTTFVGSTYPYWVKLARTGNTFNAYISPDGLTWTPVGTSQTIVMAQSVYIGFAVSQWWNNALVTATIDNGSITLGTMPTVSGVSPASGGTGTSVTVTGSNFGSPQGSSALNFNGAPATSITSWTNNQIVAAVPSNATTGPVTVVVNSIPSNNNFGFTFYHPVVTSVTPSTAQVGATVTVTGTGFGNAQYTGCQVSFNGQSGIVLSWSDTSITVGIPTGATSGPLTVTEGGIPSNSLSFTVENLSVTNISPNIGPAGTPVTISGTGFGATQANGTVDFFGTTATIQSWSDTQIVATLPATASSGSVNVTVGGVRLFGPHFTITRTIQITDSKSNQSSYTSALVGGLWVPTTVQGSGCSSCTERGNISYAYDPYGRPLSRTDENGHTTTYAYDSNGNVQTVTVPINSTTSATTTYTYNILGEVLTVTDPLGNVTTNSYDANGNLLSVTTPAPGNGPSASATQFAYNSLGELTKITDPLNNQTTIAYFPTGLIQTITDAQSNVTTYAYDSQGNRTSVTDANNKQTTFTYDAMNRLTKITYPDTTFTQFGYDIRGRRTSVTDQNGKQTTYGYDDADRLTTVTDAATNVTTYGYDTESNLTSIQDANHNSTTFDYDAFGRVTTTHFPSGHIEQYGYDNVGNLTSKTDRKNQQITYTYDQLNRLTQKTYPDTSTVNYTYDNDSRLTQVTDPTGTYQFTFDNMGRLTGTTTSYAFLTGRNFTTSYGYDAASNRTSFTDPENGATSYAYDTLNRLQTLTPPAPISGGNFGFGYDALSRRTSLTRPNSVNTTYGYDNLSHLLSVTHAKGSTTLDGASYGLDNAGNRTSKNDLYAGVTTNYGYDNIYELLSAAQGGTTKESYTYDPVGNRLTALGSAAWSYNTSNELTARPSFSYTYDLNGNTQTSIGSSGTTTYNWDYENRLTSVVLPGSGGTVSFKYDPFGRRIYKSSSSGTSVYAYDGDNLIEETNASGGVVARYSQGLNIDEPLAMLRGGTTSYYQADGLGSLTSLSNTSGALANTYTYDSFGSLTASTGSLTNSFRYTGREFDAETSLYYYRARYYDSGTGRFIDEDPSAQGSNFYRYVENDPTDLVDPLGLYTIAPAKPGHPVTPPPSPALDKLLNCMENRLHISLTVTSTTEGKHQDPGHAAGTSVDIRPPSGISADAVFCAAGQCGSPWGINEGQTGSPTPYTTGFNYHIQLRPPNSPHPKSKNAIPANCTPPSCSASN